VPCMLDAVIQTRDTPVGLTRVNPFFSNEKPGRRSLSDSNTRG
jgi:hypothetical protein